LCHAKIARKAAHDGDEKVGEEAMKNALKSWEDLEKNHAATTWAARAAFERVVLRAGVDGTVDSDAAAKVLARYPNDPAGARLLERLGDHYSALGGTENLTRAANYYAQALNAGESSDALWLKSGVARASLGKHDEAVRTFQRLAESDTRVGLRAAFEAGRSLRELKRYRDAIDYFDRVSARDPRGSFGAGAALQAADCEYLGKSYDRALRRYEAAGRLATKDDRRWQVSHRIGLCLKQMGRNAEALERLLECVTSEGGGALRARAYQDAAEVAERLRDYDTQRNILEAFVDEVGTGKEVAAASRKLVRAYLASGSAEQAHALASRMDRETDVKTDAEPRALLAMALYRQGNSSDAKKREDEVAKVVGPDAPIVREIGVEAARYHYDQKAYKAAAEAIRPYAQDCSGEGVCEEARYLYAMSLFADKQLQEGSAVAQAFFRDYPVSGRGPMLHLRMGNVLATSGRRSESLLHYDEAAETAQDTTIAVMALKNLGTSYQQLKRWHDAEVVWERVLERFPSSASATEAAMNRAQCRMEQGKYEGAIAAYQEAMPKLDSESKAWAFYWVGQSYEQLGNTQAAVVEYLKVPYLAKSGGMLIVTAQLKAAECYAKISRPGAARDLYTKVLNAHGANSNWGKLAQKGLAGLDGSAQNSNPGGGD
jgi:tetratricopeptide (TPR) repeat protein